MATRTRPRTRSRGTTGGIAGLLLAPFRFLASAVRRLMAIFTPNSRRRRY